MTIEKILTQLGDRFRELTWHPTKQEWTAVGIPDNSGKTHKEWKSHKILKGGNTPQEALENLLEKLKEL